MSCDCTGPARASKGTSGELVYRFSADGVAEETESWLSARALIQSPDGLTRYVTLTEYTADDTNGEIAFAYTSDDFDGAPWDQAVIVVQQKTVADPVEWKEWYREELILLPTSPDPE